jgi:hypothetical protein
MMKNPSPDQENPAVYHGRFRRGLSWLLARLKVQDVPHIQRIIVTVVGGAVLIFGLTLIVLPGQVVVIVAGLAILGTEYAWARYLLRKGRQLASRALSRTQRMVHRRSAPAETTAKVPSPEPAPEETVPSVAGSWTQDSPSGL